MFLLQRRIGLCGDATRATLKPDRRQARRRLPVAELALLTESVSKRKIHLPAIMRAMKNFNSLTALQPH